MCNSTLVLGITLTRKKEWKPTKGTPGSRKGPTPHPTSRKRKRGRKDKFSSRTLAALFADSDRNSTKSCDQLAARLCERLSQESASSQSVIDRPRKRTKKGTFTISGKDVSKRLNSGATHTRKNEVGNLRGKGRIARTVKNMEKRVVNWNPKHRAEFILKRQKREMWIILHLDSTPVDKKEFDQKRGRAPSGKVPKKKQNESIFGGGTAFIASWPGTVPTCGSFTDQGTEPGCYAKLELDLRRCSDVKNGRQCSHFARSGPARKHGGSSTAPIHRYHISKMIESMLLSRGISESNKKLRQEKNKRPTVTIQLDKSTCMTENTSLNDFGYAGVPNPQLLKLIAQLERKYFVKIKVEVQPTHSFDYNAQDTFLNHEIKRLLKQEGEPKHTEDLVSKFNTAVTKVSDEAIQKGFIRAYSRDAFGNEDDSLVPNTLRAWGSSDVDSDYDVESYSNSSESSDEESVSNSDCSESSGEEDYSESESE
tara:strand:+ start:280 stop:1722 length:1443 start_codon:yes stop_codon:yes gene_type:complete